MKSIVFMLSFLVISTAYSQNLQIHYELDKEREYFLTTLELFKPDGYGASFLFVDMEYNNPGNKSMSLAYWEFARYINFPFAKKLSVTIQYNDGTALWGPIGNVWLAGLSYPIHLGPVTLTTDFLLRSAYGSNSPDGQLTMVWFKSFWGDHIHFTGYLDVFSRDHGNNDKKIVVLAEPQAWYNANKHLAIGSEVKISKNFLPLAGWKLYPTIAVKWNF